MPASVDKPVISNKSVAILAQAAMKSRGAGHACADEGTSLRALAQIQLRLERLESLEARRCC